MSNKLHEKAKKDLMPIPRKVRIRIDIIFAVGIFCGLVLFPLYMIIKAGRKIIPEDLMVIALGLIGSLSFSLFAYRAIKKSP